MNASNGFERLKVYVFGVVDIDSVHAAVDDGG